MAAQRRRAPLDAATLALIKIDSEESDLTLAAIGVKYGISASYVSRLGRERGWLLRSQRMGRRPRIDAPATVAGRAFIAHRLCGVISRKLEQMEKDMESGALSSADLERDAKSVGSMIAGMDKMTPGAGAAKAPPPAKTAEAATASIDEVERLQREIIERFERIQRRRQSQAGSE